MSLFNQLRRLCQRDRFQFEDFHTEIVAQVLRNSRPLTLSWLQAIGATGLKDPDQIKIVTQEDFPALADHATDSRPDIAIRLVEGAKRELILIESKVGAKEGPGQLQRYVDHLASKSGMHRTALVFVTRDFEPPRSFSGLPPGFTFRQTRWFEFFSHLQAHLNSDGLAVQLKLFMEKNNMSLRNQFSSIDTLALEKFLAARALMDETLWGEVAAEFEKVLGKVSTRKRAIRQLGNDSRYVIYTGLGKSYDFQCLVGYWLPQEDPTEPVWVGIMLYSNPKSPVRKKVIAAFKQFSGRANSDWQQEELDDERAWSSIYKGVSLQTFMVHTDHIKAIKDYFVSLLGELREFKKGHPGLPWTAQDTKSEDDEG